MLFTVDRIPPDLRLPPSVISELFGFRNLSLSDFPPLFLTPLLMACPITAAEACQEITERSRRTKKQMPRGAC